jgi:hypothetical protein
MPYVLHYVNVVRFFDYAHERGVAFGVLANLAGVYFRDAMTLGTQNDLLFDVADGIGQFVCPLGTSPHQEKRESFGSFLPDAG